MWANSCPLFALLAVYYRALVNFTNSLVYGPELEDIFSTGFTEISDAVVDTVGPSLHLHHPRALHSDREGPTPGLTPGVGPSLHVGTPGGDRYR